MPNVRYIPQTSKMAVHKHSDFKLTVVAQHEGQSGRTSNDRGAIAPVARPLGDVVPAVPGLRLLADGPQEQCVALRRVRGPRCIQQPPQPRRDRPAGDRAPGRLLFANPPGGGVRFIVVRGACGAFSARGRGVSPVQRPRVFVSDRGRWSLKKSMFVYDQGGVV